MPADRPTRPEAPLELTIRNAVEADAGPLAVLAESTFRDAFGERNTPEDMNLHCERHFSAARQGEEIRDPTLTTLLAETAAGLAGYLQLRWGSASPAVDARRPAEIERLYVASHWHGGGVARPLMNKALQLAQARGVDQVWLGVWEHNPRAIAFYEKCGFETVGEQTFVLGRDPQRDVVMTLPAAGLP